MSKDEPIRDLFNNPDDTNNITIGFNNVQVGIDDWRIIGGTRWSRFKFRLKHPIVYSKRGLRNLWRRVKRIFVNPKIIPYRTWMNKKDLCKDKVL